MNEERNLVGDDFFEEKKKTVGTDRIIFLRENNKMWVSGYIDGDVVYSHSIMDTRFYKGNVRTKRKSGVEDSIPFIISESVLTQVDFCFPNGMFVEMAGMFRSRSNEYDGKRHLDLYLFVSYIKVYEEEQPNENIVYLEGTVCKPVVLRTTPLTRIKIADVFLTVNYNKWTSFHIPCIAWKNAAEGVAKFKVGDKMRIFARVQSRVYNKRLSEEVTEERTAYEVSIYYLKRINKN